MVESSRFALGPVELAWEQRGRGEPPLVLVHGYTGSRFDFAGHLDGLAAERRVVTVDLPGHGDSTKTGDPSTYTVAGFVDDLAAFITEAVGPPVHLLGHSLGGRVALGLTLDHPDLVASLVLMDTTAGSFVAGLTEEAAQAVAGAFRSGDVDTLADLFGDQPEDALIAGVTDEAWQRAKEAQQAKVDPVAVAALGGAIFGSELPPLVERLDHVAVPTTVIVGEYDGALVDGSRTLAAGITGAHLVVIPGAYHSPQVTHAVEWRAAVDAHLVRASRPRG